MGVKSLSVRGMVGDLLSYLSPYVERLPSVVSLPILRLLLSQALLFSMASDKQPSHSSSHSSSHKSSTKLTHESSYPDSSKPYDGGYVSTSTYLKNQKTGSWPPSKSSSKSSSSSKQEKGGVLVCSVRCWGT